MANQFKPKDILTNYWFMDSVFQNTECELMLRNIVRMQKKNNPDEWLPFSWDEYKLFCTHRVSMIEKDVLDAFVNGGSPCSNTSARITGGWLSFENDKYAFTEKMITMLGENYAAK